MTVQQPRKRARVSKAFNDEKILKCGCGCGNYHVALLPDEQFKGVVVEPIGGQVSADEQLAREWLLKEAKCVHTHASEPAIEEIAALLASRALEEAKWWREWYNQEDNASQYEHDRAVQRIAALEQATASKAAGGEK